MDTNKKVISENPDKIKTARATVAAYEKAIPKAEKDLKKLQKKETKASKNETKTEES